MSSREPLLTPAQAGERCRVCAKTVLRAIHSGRLRAYRLGERTAYRIAIEDLEEWIEQSVVTPATPAPISAPLRTYEPPSAGRLVLTPEMGANRRS